MVCALQMKASILDMPRDTVYRAKLLNFHKLTFKSSEVTKPCTYFTELSNKITAVVVK